VKLNDDIVIAEGVAGAGFQVGLSRQAFGNQHVVLW